MLAKKGTELSDIKTVRSHPIALAQCHDFLVKNKIKGIPEFDTAGSSELLSKNDLIKDEGTISSSLSAEYYNLEIIDDSIQKVETNFTRFVVFVKEEKEVKEILEIPLTDLFDPTIEKETRVKLKGGVQLKTPYLELNNSVVWGATAAILAEFKSVLKDKQILFQKD